MSLVEREERDVIMERYAKLSYTSNPNMQQYVGSYGYLSCDAYGRYAFRMEETGQIIQTSATKPNTTLGDVNHPVCRNIGFETLSGSAYQFDFMDIERLFDGVRKVDNQFLGFEHDYGNELKYKVGDHVVTPDGIKGIVIGVERFGEGRRTEINVALETGGTCWYQPNALNALGDCLASRIADAQMASLGTGNAGRDMTGEKERSL